MAINPKMKKKMKTLYQIDGNGNVHYGVREGIVRSRYKPCSFWNRPVFLVATIVVCALIDYFCFSQVLGSFLLDSAPVRSMSICALLFAFDFVPIYLGENLRKRSQGYNVSIVLLACMIGCFVVAFAANVLLRFTFRDIVLPDFSSAQSQSAFGSFDGGASAAAIAGSAAGTSAAANTGAASSAGSPYALPYAIFASVLPLLTSIGSFTISFVMSNPLADELKKLEEEHIMLASCAGQLDAILREYDSDPDFYERLMKDDDEKYVEMKQMIYAKRGSYRDYVRERLKEHLGDAAATSELSVPRGGVGAEITDISANPTTVPLKVVI